MAWVPVLPALEPDALWVAQDVQGRDRATKRFRRYGSWVEYEVALFDSGLQHLYELVPDGARTPVWFFADHDCREADARGMGEAEFVAEVCRAHRSHFQLRPADLGSTMFVSSTCRPGKLSVHVKVNLETTLVGARAHAEAICRECPDERLHPDLSVYSGRAQQIRAIGHSKLSCAVKKTAVAGCRGRKCTHAVRVSPGHGMEVISRPEPEARPPAKRRAADPSLGAEVAVRAALAGSLLPSLLGGLFDADLCVLEDPRATADGEMLSCYLDGSARRGGTLVCPLAGRAHRSNRARVLVRPNGGDREGRPGTGEVEYRCMDEACRADGKRLVAPYDVRGRGPGQGRCPAGPGPAPRTRP